MILLWNSAAMTVEVSFVTDTLQRDSEWQANRSLARDMLRYLRDELAKDEMTMADITGIGVFRGPGSYTGLRIGLTVMNTLASSLNVPIVGVTQSDWRQECLRRLHAGDNDQLVLPEYDGDAHITKPRK